MPPEFILDHGNNDLQLTISLVDNMGLYKNHTTNPKKEFPQTLVFSHTVSNHVLVTKLIDNIKTINIVVVIIIDVQSQKYISGIEPVTGSNTEQIFAVQKLQQNTWK